MIVNKTKREKLFLVNHPILSKVKLYSVVGDLDATYFYSISTTLEIEKLKKIIVFTVLLCSHESFGLPYQLCYSRNSS